MHEVGYIRISRKKLYPLTEILFVVLCGSICGAESWRDFVLFSESKIELLKEYYPFSNGIACKDTFARVFAILDPEAFKSCFVSWVKSLQSALQAVRAHWMVENNLQWTLDVVFNEDQSRVRKDHAGENMAIVRHIVINMLNKAKGAFKGVGLKALRKKAGWDNDTLSFILKQGLT